MPAKEFIVIGLGRFGGGLATTLVGMGHEVLGVDADPIELSRTEARLRALGHPPESLVVRQLNFAGLAGFVAAESPGGADVIFDPVGGDYAEPALRSIAWGGRYLVVGFPAGIPKLPLNLTLLKSCDVCGVFWGAFAARDPAANAAHIQQLFKWWDEGKIAPRISSTCPPTRPNSPLSGS